MIALDTNILIRLIVYDDAAQARAVERLFLKARREQIAMFVTDIVLCELAWVLGKRHRLSRAEVADELDNLLQTELIVVPNEGIASRAVAAYRDGKGDFADYLIREQGISHEANEVVTFDRSLKGESGFRLLT